MSNSRQIYKTNKKKQFRKRVFLWIITPILALGIGALTYGTFLYSKVHSVMNESYEPVERESPKRETTVDPSFDNTSVLFIGVDDSDTRNFEGSSRSDALMLATFNEKEKSIKLLSIPRDSYVYIPEVGYEDKITHAHAYGGPAATIETVEGLFDIPIDYYVKMNFDAFIEVVDALGGIQVEVPYAISEQDSKDRQDAIQLDPGLQELNGEEALALARTRKQDSDIERGKRQQEILKAIINEAISVKSITKYSSVIEAVGNNLTTDLTFDDMKSFIEYAAAGKSLNVETVNLAGQDSYINGIYYYELDENELNLIRENLKSHLEISTTVEENSYDTNTNIPTNE